jgi:ADP-heptose:LPS heptosyltransferase
VAVLYSNGGGQCGDYIGAMRLKRLELAWRTLWIRVLVRLMRAAPHPPRWDDRPRRVLFLRHDRAGDMILSTTVLRAIALSHPSLELDVLASPANAAILSAAPYVARVHSFDKRRLRDYVRVTRALRARRYDAVIDCMVTAPSLTTLLLMLASGAEHRVGIAGRGNDAAFSLTVPGDVRVEAHMIDRLGALAAAFGIEPASLGRTPTLHVTSTETAAAESIWGGVAAPQSPRILVNVSAGTVARRWPVERYTAVLAHMRARAPGARVRVIGAPAEWDRVIAVAASDPGAEAVRTGSLRDVMALVATADFVFTPDTSVAHIASGFARPCVAMYLRGTSVRWGLLSPASRDVEHPASTLDDLDVEPVTRAIDTVWSEAGLTGRSRSPL